MWELQLSFEDSCFVVCIGLVSTHVDTSRKVARLAVALKARYRFFFFCGKKHKIAICKVFRVKPECFMEE